MTDTCSYMLLRIGLKVKRKLSSILIKERYLVKLI
jgi:hypothetical protein